jgi:hypothetical protein
MRCLALCLFTSLQVSAGLKIPSPLLGNDRDYKTADRMEEFQGSPTGQNSSRAILDVSALLDLNGKAVALWQLMKHCETTDRIREVYLQNSWACPRSESAKLRQAIFAFHREIQGFLTSTLLQEGDYYRIKFQEVISEDFPKLHPLVVQSIFESLATEKLYWLLDYRRKENLGLSAAKSKYLLNHWLVLRTIAESDCSQWGLWPSGALSLSMGWLTSKKAIVAEDRNFVGGLVWSYGRASARLGRACGSANDLPEPYFENWTKVIKIFRAVACQYRKPCG